MIPGDPVPLERHRSRVIIQQPKLFAQLRIDRSDRGIVRAVMNCAFVHQYETDWMKDMKLYVQRHAIRAMRATGSMAPLDGPLHLTLYFGIPQPKSRPRSRPLPDSKPDFDNLTKLVCDALNGIAWMDDAQVTDCIVKKRYDVQPRTEIVVRPLTAAEAAA